MGEDAFPRNLLSRTDPRVRILFALLFALALVSLRRWAALGAGVFAAAALHGLSEADVRTSLRRLGEVNLFVLLLLATLPWSVPGEALFAIGTWTWSAAGGAAALRIGLIANGVMLAAGALLAPLEPARLGGALRGLGLPARLTHLLLFTVRYLDVLGKEYRRLRDAMRLRGFRMRPSLHALRATGYLVGMMLVRSVDRSERILEAMKCRGFRGRLPSLAPDRFGGRDLLAGGAGLLLLAGLLWLERGGPAG